MAVTQRNQAVLAKEYFDVPVTFAPGQDRVGIDQTLGDIVIPRANIGVSGANFEVLIGFDVTPQQAVDVIRSAQGVAAGENRAVPMSAVWPALQAGPGGAALAAAVATAVAPVAAMPAMPAP